MKITKRLYAYPVLAADKDDYRKAIFSVEMSEHMELTDFVLHFSVQLTRSPIRQIGCHATLGSPNIRSRIPADAMASSL